MVAQNRSLDRGIMVLEALGREGGMTLAELHRSTELPKSTLRRLLATLMERRIVRKSLADDRYRSTVTFPGQPKSGLPPHMSVLADIALPETLQLTNDIGWPSDIHMRDGSTMRIVESTRSVSPFTLYRGVINRRLNHFGSASGVACLTAMQDSEIAELDRLTAGDAKWGLARFGMTYDSFMPKLEAIRKKGYGFRLAQYLGETVLDDQLSAIALPLHRNGVPIGACSILFLRVFAKVPEFAERHLEDLRKTADRINRNIAQVDPQVF